MSEENVSVENVAVVEGAEAVPVKEQTDLEKLQEALENLKQAGETLFADQIAELESKIEEEKAKVEAETEKAVEVVTQTEQSFVQKYGAGTARTIEIVLLGLILYKLF